MAGKRKNPFEKEPEKPVHCAHDDCDRSAMSCIKLKTGYANLCRFHYDQHFTLEARRANAERGLTTVDQMRVWCKQKLGTHRPAGRWWKQEVLSKISSGQHVTLAAYDLAKYHSILEPQTEREPGSDDE